MAIQRLRRRQWQPTAVLLPGKSHGRRSLVGCSPRGREESDSTERVHFHFSLSCIGEGNGSPLQCSCLENPRDGGAWRAAVYGVTQSRTRLKRLSSSRSSSRDWWEWHGKPEQKVWRAGVIAVPFEVCFAESPRHQVLLWSRPPTSQQLHKWQQQYHEPWEFLTFLNTYSKPSTFVTFYKHSLIVLRF